jgi:hypothetical protein
MSGILTLVGCRILHPTRCGSKHDRHRIAKGASDKISTATSGKNGSIDLSASCPLQPEVDIPNPTFREQAVAPTMDSRGPLLRRKRKFTAAGGTSEKCQKPTSGRGRHTAAQRDGKRDQQQACQRKPDNRISHVLATRMWTMPNVFVTIAAMRWIVGGKAPQGRAASPSQMGR